jgi:hypothetical protein
VIIDTVTEWYCPNCGLTDQTRGIVPNRYHNCAQLRGGLTAPMLRKGVNAKVEARERDDYVGGELVQHAPDGRPVMSVVTTRDDGTDALVFAPTAYGGVVPRRPQPRMKKVLYRGMN